MQLSKTHHLTTLDTDFILNNSAVKLSMLNAFNAVQVSLL